MSDYHIPVLLKESIEGLNIKVDGIYVDLTFGGGGHSRLILESLEEKGRLIAVDQDFDATVNIIKDKRLEFVKTNFRYLRRHLKYLGIEGVDGVLADLGVSSFQFDEASRGFSYKQSQALDMRMNSEIKSTAADILNEYSELDLSKLFWEYAEIRNARRLARAIVAERNRMPFNLVEHFLDFLRPFSPAKPEKYWSKVFQALRIEVNDELEALKEMLEQLPYCLNDGARVSIISYHSLEDRLVKRFFRSGNIKGNIQKDEYGNVLSNFKIINKKIIVPSDEEIETNVRARSAKLRIAEFIK